MSASGHRHASSDQRSLRLGPNDVWIASSSPDLLSSTGTGTNLEGITFAPAPISPIRRWRTKQTLFGVWGSGARRRLDVQRGQRALAHGPGGPVDELAPAKAQRGRALITAMWGASANDISSRRPRSQFNTLAFHRLALGPVGATGHPSGRLQPRSRQRRHRPSKEGLLQRRLGARTAPKSGSLARTERRVVRKGGRTAARIWTPINMWNVARSASRLGKHQWCGWLGGARWRRPPPFSSGRRLGRIASRPSICRRRPRALRR